MSRSESWVRVAGQPARWVPETEAIATLADRGLQYGDGLFETVRVQDARPWEFARHWQRLLGGAAVLGFGELPATAQEVAAAMAEVAGRQGVTRGYARLTLSRGTGPRGYAPPAAPQAWLAVQVAAWQPDPGLLAQGHRLVFAPLPVNEHTPLTALKTLSSLEKVLARQYAAREGATEALLLNTRGDLVEASSANLFWVEDGGLCTPSLATGALPGVMRSLVLERAAALSIPVLEVRAPRPERLTDASEAFLTNVLWGIAPIADIAGRPLPVSGVITQRLQAAFPA